MQKLNTYLPSPKRVIIQSKCKAELWVLARELTFLPQIHARSFKRIPSVVVEI
jgi:hypothetical protein